MHAPSVGEGLQARPVLELMRRRRPDLQLAYTHFSPSAAAFAAGLDVDFRDYRGLDTPGDATVGLDALRPTALVFSRLDVWPTLVRLADERDVRLGIVSATMATGSSRRSGMARALLTDAYRRLDLVGAIDPLDAERLVALGVPASAIEITGDTRYDQVWQRAQRADRQSSLLAPLASTRPTIVAGSTWPADEAVLLPAFLTLRQTIVGARLIIAPHEVEPATLASIEMWAREQGLSVARLGTDTAATSDVVVVDRLGVLGDLYALAAVAFVGGGFHGAGLHSVLEPAAFGVPVAYGPRHEGSRDAMLLLARGGAATASSSSALARLLTDWLRDDALRADAGERARALVRSGTGAAERSFALVDRLLGN